MFHQVEGLVVGKGVTLADLKGTLEALVHALFGDTAAKRIVAEGRRRFSLALDSVLDPERSRGLEWMLWC